MKCLLIPVDFSATTTNMLQYIAALSNDYRIEEIILLKVFHVSQLAKLYPSPDLLQNGDDEIARIKQQEELRFHDLCTAFAEKVNKNTVVIPIWATGELPALIAGILEDKEPNLIAIGNPLSSYDIEQSLKEFIVPIAQMSNVPVLLIPDQVKYQNFDKVLLPTSFKSLEKLNSFKKLAKSQTWFQAEILVLNVDNEHRHDEIELDDEDILKRYLAGFHFQINYAYGQDIAEEILHYATQKDVQLILALPGKHSFLYNLTHKSVTRAFALEARFPILLLK